MCNEAVRLHPYLLQYGPDNFKTEEVGIKALEVGLWLFKYIPNHLKTRNMCNEAVKDDSFSLQYVPDSFVTQEQIDLRYVDYYDDGDYWDDDNDEHKFFE